MRLFLFCCFIYMIPAVLHVAVIQAGDKKEDALSWEVSDNAERVVAIRGTGARSNPVRTRLQEPFRGEQLFVRFRLRYRGSTIDTPVDDEGEFFVLWLDDNGGQSNSTHSGGTPNVGIHVDQKKNRFMARYAARGERFATELTGDRDYLVVARLWKSQPGAAESFDQLSLWIDPQAGDELKPATSVSSAKTISQVSWIGFSTGVKTESEDYISVWDMGVAKSWQEIMRLPTKAVMPKPHAPISRQVDFDKDVYPVLKQKCFSCHAGKEADIRLDIHDEVLNLVKPYDASKSHLIEMIVSGEMPPEDEPQLTNAELTMLRTWIDEGLIWNRKLLPPPQPKTDHWAFQPIVRPQIPLVKNTAWVQTPVDAFIARKQEAAGVKPSPPATKEVLARRMSLDLTGLPPEQPTTSVEQLLKNPAYGRRWGRHWLDIARWAESNGHQHNQLRPHAWRYRDWVVDAFNRNLPFDEFLAAQIAGDELPRRTPDDDSRLIATGFLAAARYSGNELDKRIQRNDILVDIVNTTGNAFLGLTFSCVQCHTHKFDPLSIRDYYRMQAFFTKGQPANICLDSVGLDEKHTAAPVAERWEIFDRNYQRLVNIKRRQGDPSPTLVLPKTVVAKLPAEDKQRFQQLEKQIASLPQTWGYYAPASASERRTVAPHKMRWPLSRDASFLAGLPTNILLRGDINSPGPEVQPGWPLVFGETGELGERPRVALAEWMTSHRNPLTARVWANRIWHWHFGRGLVATVGDFGKQGARPSHPHLLDFLASELIDSDWNTNYIHRLIMNSATYRQASTHSETNAKLDPANKTYWRWRPRRLEAEAIRDCMLAASGRLDPSGGGPSASATSSNRQSLYLTQRRQTLPHQQMLFDGAGAIVSCSRRRTSTNALQPLWLLNSDFANQCAKSLAGRAKTARDAFKLCLRREPSVAELDALETHAKKFGLPSACLVLLNTSEFLYIP